MCRPAVDEQGRTYGLLYVVRRQGSGRHGDALWLCRCQCGKETVVRGNRLREGKTRSCGCLRGRPTGESAFRRVVASTKYGGGRRGHEWGLTLEHLRVLHKQPCHYCGARPSNVYTTPSGDTYTYSGIDRADNAKGYTPDNAVPCCETCNRAKRTMTQAKFAEWIARVYEHYASMWE